VGFKDQLRNFVLRFQVIIYSFLGVLWFPALIGFFRTRNRIYWLTVFLFMVSLAAIAADQTRVIAIVTFPLFFFAFLDNQKRLGELSRSSISKLALLYLVIPYFWVWNGNPQASSSPYLSFLVQAFLRGLPIEPGIWHPLPFVK
jgi:hypothetical protein